MKDVNLLRYPGGKQRLLQYLRSHFPVPLLIEGRLVEPFVGGASVFFGLHPHHALLADINAELIELYLGLRSSPTAIWDLFHSFPATKEAYYQIRNANTNDLDLPARAARTLYLNRTCFKGMWRHNERGQFNVGYGGQDRRWVICKETLLDVSRRLACAEVRRSDFEVVIEECGQQDFLFIDPPYKPGAREIPREHYAYCAFRYQDQQRLHAALARASRRGVQWAMTNSSHPDIVSLYVGDRIVSLPMGTGTRPGVLTTRCGEVLICNY